MLLQSCTLQQLIFVTCLKLINSSVKVIPHSPPCFSYDRCLGEGPKPDRITWWPAVWEVKRRFWSNHVRNEASACVEMYERSGGRQQKSR